MAENISDDNRAVQNGSDHNSEQKHNADQTSISKHGSDQVNTGNHGVDALASFVTGVMKTPEQKAAEQAAEQEAQKQAEKRIEKFFEKVFVADLGSDGEKRFQAKHMYSTEELDEIKNGMVQRCGKKPEKIDNYFDSLRDIIYERESATRHYNNVARQMAEILEFEHNPNNLNDFKGEIRQFPSNEEVGTNFQNFIGGSKSEIDRIKNRNRPIIHTKAPSKNYRNNVVDTNAVALDEVKINNKKLELLLKEGRAINAAEENQLKSRNELVNKFSNLGECFLSAANAGVEALGKGIISSTKSSDTNSWKKNMAKRGELLSDFYKHMPNMHSSMYLTALNSANEALARQGDFSNGDMSDPATYIRIKAVLDQEAARLNALNEEELKKMKEDLRQQTENMMQGGQAIPGSKEFTKGLEERTKESDDAWKWQLGCAMFIAGPLFPGVLFIGPLFDFLGPLAQLLEPLFTADNLAEGLSNFVTSDFWGPIGDLMGYMEVDTAIEVVVGNIPGVGVVDGLLYNETMGTLGSFVAPVIQNQGAQLAVGVMAGAYLAHGAHERRQDRLIAEKVDERNLKDIFKKYENIRDEGAKVDTEKMAQDYLKASEIGNRESKLIKFIMDNRDRSDLADVFKDLKEGEKDLHKIWGDSSLSAIDIAELMQKTDAKLLQQAMDRFMAYEAVLEEGRNIDQFKKLQPAEMQKKAVGQAEKIRADFLVDKAIEAGVEGLNGTPEENRKFLLADNEKLDAITKQIISHSDNHFKDIIEVHHGFRDTEMEVVSEHDGRKKFPGASPNAIEAKNMASMLSNRSPQPLGFSQ